MSAPAAALTSTVSGVELMRHVQAFAGRVKLSGTHEELESFHYLKSQLDGLGFRTRLLAHDAFISLPGPAGVEVGNAALVAITHSFSAPSPAGGLRGLLTDVGEGTAADFRRSDLAGRIILVEGIASPAVAARASAAGAVGQIHISPQEHLHEMCISPVWGNPSDATRDALPTTVACTVAQSDGLRLRERLVRGETLEVVLHAAVDTGWRPTPLLEAELDGQGGGTAPFILFSGHHDTWYEGVMDNGAANATMLEAARVLRAHASEWRRGLRLCFWSGHSHGRYSGSAWYADHHWDELDRRCAVHVNVDSTGGIGATVLTETAVTPEAVGLAAEAILAETGQRYLGKRPVRNSDQSFWGIGVPSMFGGLSTQVPGSATFGPPKMRNALGWWWHTPHDRIDKIDEQFLLRDTRVFVHVLWRLLTDASLPLDPLAAIGPLVRELRDLAPLLPKDVPVTEVIAAAEALLALAGGPGVKDDRAIMAACRALIPLVMTEGDRFSHDAALPQPSWPILGSLRECAKAATGTDRERFLSVSAVRACNRVSDALRRTRWALGG